MLSCTDFSPYIGQFALQITIDNVSMSLTLYAAMGEGEYLHLLFKGQRTARLSHSFLLANSKAYESLVAEIENSKVQSSGITITDIAESLANSGSLSIT